MSAARRKVGEVLFADADGVPVVVIKALAPLAFILLPVLRESLLNVLGFADVDFGSHTFYNPDYEVDSFAVWEFVLGYLAVHYLDVTGPIVGSGREGAAIWSCPAFTDSSQLSITPLRHTASSRS